MSADVQEAPTVESVPADDGLDASDAEASANDSIRSRFTVLSDNEDTNKDESKPTEPSVMSVGSDGELHPRRSFKPSNVSEDANATKKSEKSEKSEVSEKSISRYSVNSSRMTVPSDRSGLHIPTLSRWDTTISTTVDVPLVPVMQSTRVSENTSDGISSLPSDYLHDSENYGVPSKHSSHDPSSSGSDPSSNPSVPLSSRNDSTLHTEIGPHPRFDVTERLLENSEVIYNERQGVAQLSRLPSTQWISGHLSCVYRSSAHRLMTVSTSTF